MENVIKEDVLQALTEFDVKNDIPIPSLLEEYLHFVASTGDTVFPWDIIKVLVRRKIEQVLCDFLITSSPESVPVSPNVDPFKYALMKEKILDNLEYFTHAPFTIQRLCEVMVDPKRYYKRIDKLMRAMEKNLLVLTTMEPRRPSSPSAHMSGVMNGYEDRTNGHHLEEQEDEPMDITGPVALSQPIIGPFIDGPITVKSNEDDEDGIEDIDVDQAPDVISSQAHSFDITMVEVHQGESSQENLLQIQLQMREQQQQQRQLIIVNVEDQATVATDESSSSQSSGKTDSVEADASMSRSNENSCSNDTANDAEQGDPRLESQLDTELEQQVPQVVLCESGDPCTTSPVQFQNVSSQTNEITKTDTDLQLLSSSVVKVEDRSANVDVATDQSSTVESSQSDSIGGSNEAAATSSAAAAAAIDDASSRCLSNAESSTSPTTVTSTMTTTTTTTTTATTTAGTAGTTTATTSTSTTPTTATTTTKTPTTTATTAAAATTTTTIAATTTPTTTTTTAAATATATSLSSSAIQVATAATCLEQRTKDASNFASVSVTSQQRYADEQNLSSDEVDLSRTGSPGNEAVAKE